MMAAKIPVLEGWATKLDPVSPGLAAFFHEVADWIRRSLEHGTGFDNFGAGRTEKKVDTMIEIADILMKEWDVQRP